MDNHSLNLPERSRPSKACSHKSTIWKEDLVSCNPSSQSLRTPSRPSKLTAHDYIPNVNLVIKSMHPHASRVSQDMT